MSSEGGRTSRGTLHLAVQLADLLSGSAGARPYRTASAGDQREVISERQVSRGMRRDAPSAGAMSGVAGRRVGPHTRYRATWSWR